MPFKSGNQKRYMYANHPSIAKAWSRRYGKSKSLPSTVTNKNRLRAMRAL